MKALKLLSLIITISLLLFSCKKDVPANYVLLSGNISNTNGGELGISSLNGFSKIINVKQDGVFSDTLFINKNGLYNLRFENIRFTPYLSKGATLQFDVDVKQPTTTFKLSGDFTELNNYFLYKSGKEMDFMKSRDLNYNVEEQIFEAKIKDFQKDLETRLEAVVNIPEEIKAKELRALNYGRLLKKENYEKRHGYLTKNREFKTSDSFKKELEELSFDNGEDYLYSSDYQRLVGNNLQIRTYEYYQKDSLPYKEAFKKALSEFNNQDIKNVELYTHILRGLSMSNNKEKDLKEFLASSTNDRHKASINKLFESLKVLDLGQPSPKFENFENYDGSTTSLNDLKGKYVYIVIWATWCGPCKYEIPFLKKVEKKYHDKNIHFVSISCDKQRDKEKWKKMIADKDLGGIQLITDNDFNTSFISEYRIKGIPQFILIDPQGNIVKANAPRPSDEKLIELFNKLGI